MKVPIMYKSSDRYNAGTDVIYDDGSKLQYAPFIYAGVTAKDNGDGGGDDEEGEDTMVVNWNGEDNTLDKSYKELKDAAIAGKVIILLKQTVRDDIVLNMFVYYLSFLNNENEGEYIAIFGAVSSDDGTAETYAVEFSAETDTGVLTLVTPENG